MALCSTLFSQEELIVPRSQEALADTLSPSSLPNRSLYRKSPHLNYAFGNTEKTIGLSPRLGYDGDWFFGIGIQKGNFWVSHYGGVSRLWGAAVDYSPFDQSIRAHLGASSHVFSFIGGAQIGGAMFAYQNKELPWNLGFRPELGIGLYKGFLNYGRNIYFQKSEHYRPKNTITLSFYITTYPFS